MSNGRDWNRSVHLTRARKIQKAYIAILIDIQAKLNTLVYDIPLNSQPLLRIASDRSLAPRYPHDVDQPPNNPKQEIGCEKRGKPIGFVEEL